MSIHIRLGDSKRGNAGDDDDDDNRFPTDAVYFKVAGFKERLNGLFNGLFRMLDAELVLPYDGGAKLGAHPQQGVFNAPDKS